MLTAMPHRDSRFGTDMFGAAIPIKPTHPSSMFLGSLSPLANGQNSPPQLLRLLQTP